jgi:hypothetical protein
MCSQSNALAQPTLPRQRAKESYHSRERSKPPLPEARSSAPTYVAQLLRIRD